MPRLRFQIQARATVSIAVAAFSSLFSGAGPAARTTDHPDFASEVRIIFLSQDAKPGTWDHSGCCGYVLGPLRDLVKERYPHNFVSNDLGRLIRNDVPPYHIYNKRYCEPIGELLGANVFVMTQVRLRNPGTLPLAKWRFDVEAKVYSALDDTEAVFYSATDMGFPEAVEHVNEHKTEILQRLVGALR